MIKAVLALLVFTIPIQAYANTWDEAILNVQAQSDFLLEEATRIGDRDVAGTGTSITDAEYWYLREMRDLHYCTIAGRMLGRTEDILRLEPNYITPSDDASQAQIDHMILDALSLSQWVSAANELKGMDVALKRRRWNLSCVGQYGIPERTAFVGELPPDEPVELFRLRLEGVYADWWIGTLDTTKNSNTDRQIDIVGNGYNTSFNGRIQLDCDTERAVWLLSKDSRSEADGDEALDRLPSEVSGNALKVYCHFM
ncbi:MAG: hypothetical protein ABJH45_05610 [Paracoccaceae bacterium]